MEQNQVPIEDYKEDDVFARTTTNLKEHDRYLHAKVDFPFDLNKLFNMNYSFDILK
jgi:hypothetical protein